MKNKLVFKKLCTAAALVLSAGVMLTACGDSKPDDSTKKKHEKEKADEDDNSGVKDPLSLPDSVVGSITGTNTCSIPNCPNHANYDLSSLKLFDGNSVTTPSNYPFGTVIAGYNKSAEDMDELGIFLPERGINDAAEIYAKINYNEWFFYGVYRNSSPDSDYYYAGDTFTSYYGWQDSENVFPSDTSCYEYSYEASILEKQISAQPYCISMGAASFNSGAEYTLSAEYLVSDPTHDYACLTYATKDSSDYISKESWYAVYDVDSDARTITYTFLDSWHYDESTSKVTIKLSDRQLTYKFDFQGIYLTLIDASGEELVLVADNYRISDNADPIYMLSVEASGDMIDDIINEIYCVYKESTKEDSYCSVSNKGLSVLGFAESIVRFDEDGLFSLAYRESDGTVHSHKFVMFDCNDAGAIFTDGDNYYYYLSSWYAEYYHVDGLSYDFGTNIAAEDEILLDSLNDVEIQTLVETRNDVIDDLEEAFAANDVAATVDRQTGEITLDAEILFDVNVSSVSPEGAAVLDNFITSFTNVISKPEYEGFVKMVLIQGHTDTSGDYDMNMTLSCDRAENVLNYCLGVDGLSDEQIDLLSDLLLSEGCSYDYPIYAQDGSVDMAASRRVVFIFYIDPSFVKH